MNNSEHFVRAFVALTGHAPFRWQRRLYDEWLVLGRVPAACDIATGLGQTSVMAVWLLALAHQASGGQLSLPRRLVYVVNRRTVVDQATDTAMTLRAKLRGGRDDEPPSLQSLRDQLGTLYAKPDTDEPPLAISTLRGQLADNREWQADPARPAIVVGTVDMIGSRLLFSGYGVSARMRPFHAGLLGQDTLIVHDEAHLTPAFGHLMRAIKCRQEAQGAPRRLHLLELSATRRARDASSAFALSDDERAEEEVARRLLARKTLRLERLPTEGDDDAEPIAERALRYKDGQDRVIVFARRPGTAKKIATQIARAVGECRVTLLTGTMRGLERDAMAKGRLFRSFLAGAERERPTHTVYLIATAAGEVGVDIDADHMVSDLTTLDSMIQRLGRVNRLGRGSAEVAVVLPRNQKAKDDDTSNGTDAIDRTADALGCLPDVEGGKDASPAALRALAARTDAFAKEPRLLPLTDILLDGWAMTRLRELPGRPHVERWLHGVEASPPEVHLAWREEVRELGNADPGLLPGLLRTLYDRHPILARERLRGSLHDVAGELKRMARRAGDIRAVLLPVTGSPELARLDKLPEVGDRLREATLVLPPELGGLDGRGMLDGGITEPVRDVADREDESPERLRILLERDAEGGWRARALGLGDASNLAGAAAETGGLAAAIGAVRKHLRDRRMAEKARLVLAFDEDGEPTKALLLLARPRSIELAQESAAAAERQQELEEHLRWTREEVERIASQLSLASLGRDVVDALLVAADWHDRGKNRPAWQKAIGNPPPAPPLAKSGARGFDASACGAYRHEFGSLREAAADRAIRTHPERDLILHLIAAHHGWARPHFEPRHWDIADGVTEEENAEIATETIRRFAQLQRRFGHWGLAWLEALLRSADYAATRRLSAAGGTSGESAP